MLDIFAYQTKQGFYYADGPLGAHMRADEEGRVTYVNIFGYAEYPLLKKAIERARELL